jgi:hypothetical protein
LEAIFGGPLVQGHLNESALQAIVADATRESDQLDFKANYGFGTTATGGAWGPKQEFSKDVAAFANHRGGAIVIGVQEAGGVATGLVALTEDPEQIERTMRVAVANHVSPPVLIDVVTIPSSSGVFMIVAIPPSPRAPHGLTANPGDSRRPLSFPVRDGSDTRWLDESEVADRYYHRVTRAADQEGALTRLEDEGREALVGATWPWLFVAVLPEVRIDEPLDSRLATDIDNWYANNRESSPLQRELPFRGRGIPGHGRMVYSLWADDDAPDQPNCSYVELHVDGSAFVASAVGSQTSDDDAHLIGERTLDDDALLLVDLALLWAQHRSGAWGHAQLVAGLTGSDPTETSSGSTPLELVTTSGFDNSLRRRHRTRALRRPPRFFTAVDLAGVTSTRDRLAVTYRVLSGLLQHFGVSETSAISAEGLIRSRNWDMQWQREVERWAQQRGALDEGR